MAPTWTKKFFSNSKQEEGFQLYPLPPEEEVTLLLPTKEIENQIKLTRITKKDLQIARKIAPLIKEHSKDMVDHFYEIILQVDELKELIKKHSTTDRLKQTLTRHMGEMLSGKLDEAYYHKREKVALMHYKINLSMKWYMG